MTLKNHLAHKRHENFQVVIDFGYHKRQEEKPEQQTDLFRVFREPTAFFKITWHVNLFKADTATIGAHEKAHEPKGSRALKSTTAIMLICVVIF
ncbi:MAG: hypothetical protein PHH11_00270 [Methylomonas sp.]|nr:hypothetical protein [Methylomonas sp.]